MNICPQTVFCLAFSERSIFFTKKPRNKCPSHGRIGCCAPVLALARVNSINFCARSCFHGQWTESIPRQGVTSTLLQGRAKDQRGDNLRQVIDILVRNNRYGLAESLCRHALPVSNAAFGVDHEATLAIVQDLGVALYFQGRDSEAEDFFRQVLAASIDSESEAALLALKWLSLTLLYQGKNKEAFTVHQRALTALRKKHGSDHDAALEWGRRFSNALHGQLHENSKLFDVEECEPGSKLRRRLSEASDLQYEGLDLSQEAVYEWSQPYSVGKRILQGSFASLP
jgi:hypothetical protein